MDGKQSPTKDASGNSDVPSVKSTRNTEEQLKDFVVLDELKQSNKEVAAEEINSISTEKEPVVEVKGNSIDKDASVKDTVKEDKLKEKVSIVHDHEKNEDSLILTADEDLEPAISSPKKPNTETVPFEADESKQNITDSAGPNPSSIEPSEDSKTPAEKAPGTKNQRVIWVSNISKTIKATDLKHHLSKAGKVTTAKIVTDGKRCFGYVLMENANDAGECVKTLNNTSFDNKNILLSFDKPVKVSDTTKTTEPAPDAKKSTKEGSHHVHRASDTKRPDKRRRSSSKPSAEKSKEGKESKESKGSSESKTKAEESSDASIPKPTEKKRRTRSASRLRYLRDRDRQNLRDRDRILHDRLKHRILVEERRNHEAKLRQIEMDERQREKEFRLEQERRKLQMERELFEKQKREWARINEERRKLERARMEVEQQRAKLEDDLKKERLKHKSPDMIPPSVVSKISDPSKKNLKILKRDDFKNSYDSLAPPPPKLGMDFNHGGRKSNEGKMVRAGGRKIEVIDRKFYGESTDRKKHYSRKPEFEENKSYMKRYPGEREDEHRTQWSPPIGYGSGVGSSAPRYQETIPSQQFGGGPPSRPPSYYYHPSPSTQEFPRYDQVSNRKY